ncbi:MAG: ribonuclease R [Candidatus Abyssobacteria bacterium SURF_5]|uniref:Ribonuclease R n=1 Tax=Abyssobacteria bacterium (strain SURF_5) TaxID=2093360 RepID=A0A3A4N753_ABYX5|nr:MAG: ribonuclease R [Candidatus Abyssubacteria bacterium SURF_5]
MEKLKERVIEMLRESADRPVKLKEIARRLKIDVEATRSLRVAVKELVEAGELVQTKGKRFGVPEHMNLVVGALIGHPNGYGFVRPFPRPGQVNLPDIYVSGRDMDEAMHGDKVVTRISGHLTKERIRGEIIRVLDRANKTVIGYYEESRHFGYVVPIDFRITQHVSIDLAEAMDARPGQIVVAEIIEYPSYQRNAEGRIIEVLGWKGDRGLDTEVLIRKHGLTPEFSLAVLRAAEELLRIIPEEELRKRVDLRDVPMVTIDPTDAKDFDDAVSLEINEEGNYLLGVHIADVSHYVQEGGIIDDEAFRRGTSIYLEDRVLPMLPHRLSNELCSLRENEDKLTFSVRMEISPKGNVLSAEIFDSVIRSSHRMSYDQVFSILEGDEELTRRFSDVADTLKLMNKLAQTVRAKRIARGSLDFNFPEARAIFGSEGEVIDIVLQKHNVAHELIEEFMLLANEMVARHVTARQAPMLYRIHEEPDLEKMSEFREFIASLGYRLSESDSRTPKGLQKISHQARGKPEESLINYLMLRSLREARYSPENAGHFGLASDYYTHFTSPIRRYPDLVVHRILRTLAREGVKGVAGRYGDQLEDIAVQSSLREREAMEAERESLQMKQMVFMSGKIGDVFDGRITGVHSYGLFVEIVDFLAEGLVHVSSLDDDYYAYVEERHCLLGENTGKVYRLGDAVQVQVVRVDLEKRRMDFDLADSEAGKAPSKEKKGKPAKLLERGGAGRKKAGKRFVPGAKGKRRRR